MTTCVNQENDEMKNMTENKTTLKSVEEAAATWEVFELDLLGEIKKKLDLADNIRFGVVCKSWQLAAQHVKRPATVLPWLMVLYLDNLRITYYLYEPSSPRLYTPIISHAFELDQFFDISHLQISYKFTYFHGYLFITMFNKQVTAPYFLLLSPATKEVITLPHVDLDHRFTVSPNRCVDLFTAVSTNPTYPDCIFLSLHIINDKTRIISIFRHGDTQWTANKSSGDWFGVPCVEDVVFLHGVFYFLFSSGQLGSYDINSGELKVVNSNNELNLQYVYKFFRLDEELIVTYNDVAAPHKFCIRRFDWSQKVWVPLESLGDRSVFLSRHSVYVDTVNCYGVSVNKIYIRKERYCCVYSLENGELFECPTSSGLINWDGVQHRRSEFFVWAEPLDLLVQKV